MSLRSICPLLCNSGMIPQMHRSCRVLVRKSRARPPHRMKTDTRATGRISDSPNKQWNIMACPLSGKGSRTAPRGSRFHMSDKMAVWKSGRPGQQKLFGGPSRGFLEEEGVRRQGWPPRGKKKKKKSVEQTIHDCCRRLCINRSQEGHGKARSCAKTYGPGEAGTCCAIMQPFEAVGEEWIAAAFC